MYKTKIDNLDLKQIADSGQCFRWKNTGENEYTVVAFDRALRIKQDGNEFELDCDEADWNNIWKRGRITIHIYCQTVMQQDTGFQVKILTT